MLQNYPSAIRKDRTGKLFSDASVADPPLCSSTMGRLNW